MGPGVSKNYPQELASPSVATSSEDIKSAVVPSVVPPEALSLEERKAFFLNQTKTALLNVVNREQTTVDYTAQAQKDSGWFGSVNRVLTLSNPYELESQLAQQRLGFAKRAEQQLATAAESNPDKMPGIEELNQARRVAGLAQLDHETCLPVDENVEAGALNTAIDNRAAYQLEQAALTTSRDTVVGVGLAVLPGVGLAGKGLQAGIKGATQVAAQSAVRGSILQTAATGAVFSGSDALITGVDDVQSGNATVETAAKNVAVAATAGAVLGAAGELAPRIIKSASSLIGRVAGDASGEVVKAVSKSVKTTERLGPKLKELISDPKTQYVIEIDERGHCAAYFFNAEAVAQKLDGALFITRPVGKLQGGRDGATSLMDVESIYKGLHYVISTTEEGVESLRKFALSRAGGLSWGCSNEAAEAMKVAGTGSPAPSSFLDSKYVPKFVSSLQKYLDDLAAQQPDGIAVYNSSAHTIEELSSTIRSNDIKCTLAYGTVLVGAPVAGFAEAKYNVFRNLLEDETSAVDVKSPEIESEVK